MNEHSEAATEPAQPSVAQALNSGWRRYFFPVIIAITAMVVAFAALAYFSAQRITRIDGFTTPTAVAVGPDQRIYVADAGENATDGDGVVYVIEDNKPIVLAEGLNDPSSLSFINHSLIVVDQNEILKISSTGSSEPWLNADSFSEPPERLEDITVADENTLFVMDAGRQLVFMVQPERSSGVLIDSTNVFLSAPGGIVFDPNNNDLWVGDGVDGRLIRVGLDRTSSSIRTEQSAVNGLAMTPLGRLYMSDAGSGVVWTRTPTGEFSKVLQGLDRPTGLAFDAHNQRLVIAETGAGRITIARLN